MTLHKLKVAALQHEQREDWASAIELYRQAIREAEGGSEGGDPSLYNRVGDLAHKAGDDAGACEAWEQAVVRYADLGFLNSAIALCGKILRVSPDRVQTHLELARLQARKRVLYDVRRNLTTYLQQMTALGRADQGRKAAEQLGREFPGWRDLDTLLDEMLQRERNDVSHETSAAARHEPASGLVFLDTGPMQIERASEPAEAPDPAHHDASVIGDLEFEPRPEPDQVLGFEPTVPDAEPPARSDTLEGLIGVAQTARDLEHVEPVAGLDLRPELPPSSDAVESADDNRSVGGDLVFIDPSGDPGGNDALGERVTAHALLEHGDRVAGIARLEKSLAAYQANEEWLQAYNVAGELVQAEPRSIGRYQTRVEVASRLKDTGRLCEAYLELGDALRRDGSNDKAIAVYRRILELDDHHVGARNALRAMSPATLNDANDGFVDLGAMLIDDHPTSTRMRTEMPAVAADENDTFQDALAEFKRAIDLNLPVEEHQAHYDLGIAFKEMGLLDEAVTEFQKALRAPEVRLRTSEALGEVFFEQNRPAVAEAVLRSVEQGEEGDAEKIGVLYWMGRSLEAQGRREEALRYYQRVIAVDIAFRDASDRLAQVSGNPAG